MEGFLSKMNTVLEVIKNRRSIRKFQDKPIDAKLIKKIIGAGVFAPSSHNSQPWRVIVITNKNEIKECSGILKKWFRGLIKFGSFTALFNRKIRGEIESAKKRVESKDDLFFYNAPVLALIHSKKSKFHIKDCACAAQNMLLAARSIGIGSCWVGFADLALNKDKRFLEKMEIPKGNEIVASLIFGYPVKFPKNALPRKEEALAVKRIK